MLLVDSAMDYDVRKIDYFTTVVRDRPGEAYRILGALAERGVNLLAFTAVPIGPDHTQLTFFPEESGHLIRETAAAGLALTGPFSALIVMGDDALGALANVHERLFEADVNVYASYGLSNGSKCYGYLIYVKPESIGRALKAFEEQ